MLTIGYLLFGLIGWVVGLSPILFIIASGSFWWVLAFVPSLLLRKAFVTLSGYCHAKKIERDTGISISAQTRMWRDSGEPPM